MQHTNFIGFLTLPESSCHSLRKEKGFQLVFSLQSQSPFATCPRCCAKVTRIYDHVEVTPRDEPMRHGKVKLRVRKRRFWCKACGHIFREMLPGVRPYAKTTERLRRSFCLRCVNAKSIAAVCREWGLSTSTGHGYFSNYLDLEQRKWNCRLSEEVGIDEHSFRRIGPNKEVEFVTVLVDHKHKRVRDVAQGKDVLGIVKQFEQLPGRTQVKWFTLDMSETFLSAGTRLFPKAKPVADRFHVERRVAHAVTKERLAAVRCDERARADKKCAQELKNLVHANPEKLSSAKRNQLESWIIGFADLSRVHRARSEINAMYRCRSKAQAERKFTEIVDDLAKSSSLELRTLRETLLQWREPILNYFERRITNARVEGFNRKCKLIKRAAYGYKHFNNYRRRILIECF